MTESYKGPALKPLLLRFAVYFSVAVFCAVLIVSAIVTRHRAEARWAAFLAAEERHRVAARQRHAEAAEIAGRAGLGPQYTARVRALIDWMETRGMPRPAAGAVAPYVIDRAGRLAVSRERAMQWAAGVEAGMLPPPGGFSPAGRGAARKHMEGQLGPEKFFRESHSGP